MVTPKSSAVDRLATRTRQTLADARCVFGGLGRIRPSREAILATCSRISLAVSTVDIWEPDVHAVLAPDPRHTRRLFLNSRLPDSVQSFYVFLEIARHFLDEAEDARIVSECFALVCVLAGDDREREETMDDLRDTMGQEGPGIRLGLLLEAAEAILDSGCGDLRCGPAWSALERGKAARQAAEYDEAERLLQEAHALAAEAGDWHTAARAVLRLGNVALQRGNIPAARKRYEGAEGIAKGQGAPELLGAIYHDWFRAEMQAEAFETAYARFRAAWEAYGTGNASPLVADLATCWVLQGWNQPALQIFHAVYPRMVEPAAQLSVLGMTARAAGGAGEYQAFETAWRESWVRIALADSKEGVCRALLDMAEGAAAFEEWGRAETAAGAALRVAEDRREGQVVLESEALLQRARNKQRAPSLGAPSKTFGMEERILSSEVLLAFAN